MQKRFISGAICPRCGELDKLVTYRAEHQQFRECIKCGFKDVLEVEEKLEELDTRVTPKSPLELEGEPLKILEHPPKSTN